MIKRLITLSLLIISQRHLVVDLAKRELATKYVGSFLGVVWTFINPLVMICVFWFVFSVGFRSKPLNDVPFVVWLAAGMSPWFIFADIVSGSSNAIISNANLIKKTLFQSQILPVVQVLSCIFTHMVFVMILLGLIILQGLPLSIWMIQSVYYLVCLCVLALGISWIVSALNVFMRDVGQIVAVFLQVGFWGTPIFWDINIMPEAVQYWLKFNPMFYVIQGYRESFISFVPFWHHPLYSLYFWTIAIVMFVAGDFVFNRLKPQFADVL